MISRHGIKILSHLLFEPKLIYNRSSYLFLLSHMRSRSTVLSHILGSHPEIIGYKEMHRSYKNTIDLLRLRTALYDEFRTDLTNKMLHDRILHNQNIISDQILNSERTRFIFLLRGPDATIKSIHNLSTITGRKRFKDIEHITEYYCNRLNQIVRIAKKIKGDYFFIESDDLLYKTAKILDNLSIWLDLSEPLKHTYSIFTMTGNRKAGDPSENILAGQIKTTDGYPDVEIPEICLQTALQSYNKCKQFFKID